MSHEDIIMDSNSDSYKRVNFMDNIDLKCCDNLVSENDDIYKLKCIEVSNERISDYTTSEDFKYKIEKNGEFTIISTTNLPYDVGESILIEKVEVNYDFIGMLEEAKEELLNSNKVIFSAPVESGYNCSGKTFYNEFAWSFFNNKYYKTDSIKSGIEIRILENDAQFYICNLKIVLLGKIGSKPFKAISNTSPFTGNILDGSCLEFYGKIIIPKDANKLTIHEEYNGYLTVECIRTDNVYSYNKNTFNADVEFLFLMKKNLYLTVNEKMSVFIKPNDIIDKYSRIKELRNIEDY